MKKPKLFFIIHSLGAGGAEKSLVSLLNSIPPEKYDIDLMVIGSGGIFRPQIPEYINIIPSPLSLRALCYSFHLRQFKDEAKWHTYILKFLLVFIVRMFGNRKLQIYQRQWAIWKHIIPSLKTKYDVAISYMSGFCNYFVIDKIPYTTKKILWIHHDYSEFTENRSFDLRYFCKADAVATVSPVCKDALCKDFPNIAEKFVVIENISNASLIKKQSLDVISKHIQKEQRLKIISMGRFAPIKGMDLAIKAAHILKEKSRDFKWYFLGDGPERNNLESMITEYGLSDNIELLGVKSNPYPYIAAADIYCQPSRFEGKSIAIDEAKILCKPIVVTRYPSVSDTIENNINGLIVDIDAQSIAKGVETLLVQPQLRNRLSEYLSCHKEYNTDLVLTSFQNLLTIH